VDLSFRPPVPEDHARVAAVIDEWWGGRQMALMLPRLFFTHFADTSFIVEDEHGELAAFLIGFLSQSRPGEAYIHFVGVAPSQRGSGLGRDLYERFFSVAAERGAVRVGCVTSPRNSGSIAFHTSMGFEGHEVAGYDGAGEDRVVFTRAL
jgi:predicted GNAT superfamily acetyltransferase